MGETRKLAAILATDVVGFSRLAGADDDRTLARLRALRSDLIDPTVAVHHGRIVKRTGDGALIEFRSVVDAVRCAIEVQLGMVERNAGVVADRRIELRIGVHLGDVVQESDGDLMGDGVNVAARLEGVAEPGAICLSEDAYRQVKGRLDLAITDLGPIRVYSARGRPRLVQRQQPAREVCRNPRAVRRTHGVRGGRCRQRRAVEYATEVESCLKNGPALRACLPSRQPHDDAAERLASVRPKPPATEPLRIPHRRSRAASEAFSPLREFRGQP